MYNRENGVITTTLYTGTNFGQQQQQQQSTHTHTHTVQKLIIVHILSILFFILSE